jgi:xylose isomerase
MGDFYSISEPVRLVSRDSDEAFAFRWYEPDAMVLGKRMEDHLRFAVCWWHSFCWPGTDPFGGPTFQRDWFAGEPMQAARRKADVAFETFRLLGVPFFTFHDRDIAPEGATLAESNANLDAIGDYLSRRMEAVGTRLLWGTANLFSHRRYMAGAATNPDPEIFAYAAAQVRHAMGLTHRLGGANYVLWGGREGYETLLNTDMGRELDQLGRFLSMVVEHKHRIGFEGTILIEPKPQEPTKHQYDHDVAAIHGFLRRYDLIGEVKINIEQNHAILAGHSFEHEIALAAALGLFGSLDINRGDYQSGWDTDQFAMNVPELALALHEVLLAGGFGDGGLNFDAKLRRQSLDPDDILHAHIGGMDACARALLIAAEMVEAKALTGPRAARYAGWDGPEGRAILSGARTLDDLSARALERGTEPQPVSGRQEALEGALNRFLR